MLKSIPWRDLSRFWGHLHREFDLPLWLRAPIYKWWTWAFDCNLSEMAAKDLLEFRNLDAFFTRQLAPGVRPISGCTVVRTTNMSHALAVKHASLILL